MLLCAVWVVVAGCRRSPVEGVQTSVDQPEQLTCDRRRTAADEIEWAIVRVFPAIVRLDVITERAADGRMRKERGLGSGVIIRPEGYLITNHHVAGRATHIRCRLASGQELEGQVVGTDPLSDITVVRLNLEGRQERGPLPVAEFGDSDRVRVGDVVFAMGSPGGISQSVTRGIVSNTALILPGGSVTLDGENVGSVVRWIAHDARIFPGNSGGPLVNSDGEIVGINELAVAGIGAAIPGNLARQVAEQIIATGRVERSWIGAVGQVRPKSWPVQRGVLLASVFADSPAAEAGLRPGDVIVSYDGVEVDAAVPEALPLFNSLVLGTPIGKEVEVRFIRNGTEETTRLLTRVREPAGDRDRALREWGLTARNLTFFSAMAMRRASTDGVVVSTVSPGGPAAQAEPALQSGDIITNVAGQAVANVDELIQRTQQWMRGWEEPRPLLVEFERGLSRYLTVVRVGPPVRPERPERAPRADFPAVVQALSPALSESLGLPDTEGLRVTYVFPGSSVDRAGIRVGDIIIRFDGEPVRARRPEDVMRFGRQVRAMKPGTRVPVEVLRNRELLRFELGLEESRDPAGDAERFEVTFLEFHARALMLYDRALHKIPEDLEGLLVERVESASAAELAGLRAGDVLMELGHVATPTVAALEDAVKRIEDQKPRYVVLKVQRGIQTLFLEAEPDWLRLGPAADTAQPRAAEESEVGPKGESIE